jgi:hypothetical protein
LTQKEITARERSLIIKQLAKAESFDFVGISKAEKLEEESRQLEQWLNAGMHGQMTYMERNFEMRTDPRILVPGAKSVISLLFNYYTDIDPYQFYVIKEKLLQLHITNITARIEKGILNIRIELERPGLLIGKGGEDFNKLHNYLEEELGCLVNITIVESKLWQFNKY